MAQHFLLQTLCCNFSLFNSRLNMINARQAHTGSGYATRLHSCHSRHFALAACHEETGL